MGLDLCGKFKIFGKNFVVRLEGFGDVLYVFRGFEGLMINMEKILGFVI